jgi:thymidylate synthase (FAD)
MNTKKPKVCLVDYTKNPIELMCLAHLIMHNKAPDSIEELKKDPKKWLGMSVDEYYEKFLKLDGMPTFLEFANLTFKIENVSRNLTHQAVRHRIGMSYSQQSLRCVNLPEFASKGNYTMCEQGDKNFYHKQMLNIQEIYNEALKNKIPTQDSRGLLPMNIHTSIMMCGSFRAIKDMINKRLCLKTQSEFRSVAEQMKEHIKKIDKRLLFFIGAPCEVSNYKFCMMKAECENQYKEGKLTGTQNTNYCCPIYLSKFVNKAK